MGECGNDSEGTDPCSSRHRVRLVLSGAVWAVEVPMARWHGGPSLDTLLAVPAGLRVDRDPIPVVHVPL